MFNLVISIFNGSSKQAQGAPSLFRHKEFALKKIGLGVIPGNKIELIVNFASWKLFQRPFFLVIFKKRKTLKHKNKFFPGGRPFWEDHLHTKKNSFVKTRLHSMNRGIIRFACRGKFETVIFCYFKKAVYVIPRYSVPQKTINLFLSQGTQEFDLWLLWFQWKGPYLKDLMCILPLSKFSFWVLDGGDLTVNSYLKRLLSEFKGGAIKLCVF